MSCTSSFALSLWAIIVRSLTRGRGKSVWKAHAFQNQLVKLEQQSLHSRTISLRVLNLIGVASEGWSGKNSTARTVGYSNTWLCSPAQDDFENHLSHSKSYYLHFKVLISHTCCCEVSVVLNKWRGKTATSDSKDSNPIHTPLLSTVGRLLWLFSSISVRQRSWRSWSMTVLLFQ